MQLFRNSQFKIHKNEEIFDSMSRVFHETLASFENFSIHSLARWQSKKKSKREAPSNLIVVQLLIWIQATREKTSQNAKQNNIRFCLLFYSNSGAGSGSGKNR